MNFDRTGFAIGVLTSFALFVTIAIASDWHGLGHAELCLHSEPALACAREWANFGAIVAGAATVVFILFQMRATDRHHRENMMLQTLEMRANIGSAIHQHVEPIERILFGMARVMVKFQSGQTQGFRIDYILKTSDDVRRHIAQATDQLKRVDDGRIAEARENAEVMLRLIDGDWRVPDGYGNQVPTKKMTEDMIHDLSAAMSTVQEFVTVIRALQDEVRPGRPPSVRQRSSHQRG